MAASVRGVAVTAAQALWRIVEDEVPRAVRTIADEGAAGRTLGVLADGADIDAVALQALDADRAEIVLADAADDRTGLAEFGGLVDEDRRCTEAKGPTREIGSRNPCPGSTAMISTRISPMVRIFFINSSSCRHRR